MIKTIRFVGLGALVTSSFQPDLSTASFVLAPTQEALRRRCPRFVSEKPAMFNCGNSFIAHRLNADLPITVLKLSNSGSGSKKTKRRRKQPPGAAAPDPVKVEQGTIERIGKEEVEEYDDDDEVVSIGRAVDRSSDDTDSVVFELKSDSDISKGVSSAAKLAMTDPKATSEQLSRLVDVSKLEFKTDDKAVWDPRNEPVDTATSSEQKDSTLLLPDIKDARRKKLMEEELSRIIDEKEERRPKIKRSDREALKKLLIQQPYADADDSFFEEEEYNTVSALLGERAEKFLGIPTGPLQVGHLIGALGLVLMAYVEYPGFPLTNLPSPLRSSLQGGLGVIYGVNTILAVLAVFRAKERGQPVSLWVGKTLTVGGLAFDQLNQLPTLEELRKVESAKGARALKNKKTKN